MSSNFVAHLQCGIWQVVGGAIIFHPVSWEEKEEEGFFTHLQQQFVAS